MAGPPPSYYLTPPDNQSAPAYAGPGFAEQQPAVWRDPTAPKNTNPIIAFAMGTGTVADQFSGPAMWSIGVGILAIGLPFFTPFYFRFLPIAGLISGVRAVTSGRLIGGAVGIGLNLVAGVISLTASGILGLR
jgi:hypothetical protein